MDRPLKELDSLLGSQLADILVSVPHVDTIISEALRKNQEAFTLYAKNHSNVQHIFEFDQTLTERVFSNQEKQFNLEVLIAYIRSTVAEHLKSHFVLSNEAAAKILAMHPPLRLHMLQAQHIFSEKTPKDLLALTRFTEDDAWQQKYFSILATLSKDELVHADITTLILSPEEQAAILKLSDKPQKPWGVSHTKETGTIVFFNPEKNDATPLTVLYVLLCLHYIFEITYAARFYEKESAGTHQNFGQCIVDSILAGKNRFTFFHPNLYSENFFWEKAMSLFFEKFISSEHADKIRATWTVGDIATIDNKNVFQSLNFIDNLWDICFKNQTADAAYFKERITGNEPNFLYHFREGFWSHTFQTLLNFTDTEMEDFLVTHIGSGDQKLTQAGISTII